MKKEGTRRLNVSGELSVLGVSRNGYYSFEKRRPSGSQLEKEARMAEIREIHEDSHQNYGAPKITECLLGEGEATSGKAAGNYMREMGAKAQYIKPYMQATVDSDFSGGLENILDEQFNPEQPNAVWCSDITYIWTFGGFVYLTSIMGLYSRKITAWVLSDTLEAKWVAKAIEKAKRKRHVGKPLAMHSGRGIQYTCPAYKEATEGFINSLLKETLPMG